MVSRSLIDSPVMAVVPESSSSARLAGAVPVTGSLTAVTLIVLLSMSASLVAVPLRPGSWPVAPPSLVVIWTRSLPFYWAVGV